MQKVRFALSEELPRLLAEKDESSMLHPNVKTTR